MAISLHNTLSYLSNLHNAKFLEPMTAPSKRNISKAEDKEEKVRKREKTQFIGTITFCLPHQRAAHSLILDQCC